MDQGTLARIVCESQDLTFYWFDEKWEMGDEEVPELAIFRLIESVIYGERGSSCVHEVYELMHIVKALCLCGY